MQTLCHLLNDPACVSAILLRVEEEERVKNPAAQPIWVRTWVASLVAIVCDETCSSTAEIAQSSKPRASIDPSSPTAASLTSLTATPSPTPTIAHLSFLISNGIGEWSAAALLSIALEKAAGSGDGPGRHAERQGQKVGESNPNDSNGMLTVPATPKFAHFSTLLAQLKAGGLLAPPQLVNVLVQSLTLCISSPLLLPAYMCKIRPGSHLEGSKIIINLETSPENGTGLDSAPAGYIALVETLLEFAQGLLDRSE